MVKRGDIHAQQHYIVDPGLDHILFDPEINT